MRDRTTVRLPFVLKPTMSTSRRKPAKSQEALKKSAETYLAVPFHQYLGAELVSLDEEQACISFTTSSRLLTPAGTLHAGAMYIGLELANVSNVSRIYGARNAGLKLRIYQGHCLSTTYVNRRNSCIYQPRRITTRHRLWRRTRSENHFQSSQTWQERCLFAVGSA